MLAYAREADVTTFDPFRGVRRGEIPSPSETSKEKRVLRLSEISRLIDGTLSTYRPVVTVLCWSGMRVSEALGLRWRA